MLVIIGMIVLSVHRPGRAAQRGVPARCHRVRQGWAIGYDTFTAQQRVVIGDRGGPANPTGMVNGPNTGTPLVLAARRGAMQGGWIADAAGGRKRRNAVAYLDSKRPAATAAVCLAMWTGRNGRRRRHVQGAASAMS